MSLPQQLAMIVAASENDVIGREGGLPWHISADLKRFKQLTMGHSMIMGRKTFESIGRLLPGRTTVIITRNKNYQFGDLDLTAAMIAGSIDEALQLSANDECPFVIGGAQIYETAMPRVTQLFLTRVHAEIVGDTSLPDIDWSNWTLLATERHAADAKNNHDYSFEDYVLNLPG